MDRFFKSEMNSNFQDNQNNQASPCPCCDRSMSAEPGLRPSRDHIQPKAWGGGLPMDGRYRTICETCNSLRALAGHCLGALGCARLVAFDVYAGAIGWETRGARLVLRRWALPTPDGRRVKALMYLQRLGKTRFLAIGPRRYMGALPRGTLRVKIGFGQHLFAFGTDDDRAWFLGSTTQTYSTSIAELFSARPADRGFAARPAITSDSPTTATREKELDTAVR